MTKYSDQQLIDTTMQLMAIESVTDNPPPLNDALALIINMIRSHGKNITVERFESNGIPSILAYKGKVRPNKFKVLFNGHVDVVAAKPELFKPYIQDGVLYGRGAYDMKSAVVAMTDAFCEMVDTVPYELGLQLVADEEAAGENGTGYQVAHGVRADFVISGDCGRLPGVYELVNTSKGVCIVDLEFEGQTSHGAYLWRGDNAIVKAANFTNRLLEHYPKPDQEIHQTTANIPSIGTRNTTYSLVPDHAAVRVDFRFMANDDNFASKEKVILHLQEIDPNAKVTAFTVFCPPWYTSPTNPLLTRLKSAVEEVEKHTFTLGLRHGTSDARFYAELGIEACEFGVAGEHQHGEEESMPIQAFVDYRATLLLYLQKTCDLPAQSSPQLAHSQV